MTARNIMERRRVVITGAGAISPVTAGPDDAGLDSFWSALGSSTESNPGSGETAFRPLGDLQLDRDAETERLDRTTAAGILFDPREHLDGNYRPVDRTGQLTIIAAQRALAASGWGADERAEHEVGLVLGTMFGSLHTISAFDRRGVDAGPRFVKPLDFANSVINAAAGQAAIWLDLRGPNSTVTGGSVAGLQALGQACELIRAGRSDALLAGGADELAFESFFAFQQAGLVGSGELPRPYDVRRDGFVPGEGAALLMLESEVAASARGAEILGIVAGHGTAFDPSQGRDRASLPSALARAIRLAFDDAGLDLGEPGVDVVSSGGSGLRHTDAAEALALQQVLNGHHAETPVAAVKSTLGESLGAAGAFQSLVALGCFAGRELPGVAGFEQRDPELPELNLSAPLAAQRALLTSVSFDGLACAVVLERG